jgi:hypothetical membrane protein
MPSASWWTLLSATGAPVFLIGGWTLAATRQPAAFNSTTDTISALAALGATDRWLMTAALVLVGVCHLVTALGLRPAARTGRVVLAVGGVATALVAAFPLPFAGASAAHTATATVAFGALAVWPAAAWRRGPQTRWVLRPAVGVGAAVALVGLVAWFVVSMRTGTSVGLAERWAAGTQSLWPLVAVGALTRAARAEHTAAGMGPAPGPSGNPSS